MNILQAFTFNIHLYYGDCVNWKIFISCYKDISMSVFTFTQSNGTIFKAPLESSQCTAMCSWNRRWRRGFLTDWELIEDFRELIVWRSLRVGGCLVTTDDESVVS